MSGNDDFRELLAGCAERYPFPIASACRRFQDSPPTDPWREWELLSRDVLQSVLHYLSHLLLSDLVGSGRQPAHLYHRIQSILSRPMAGHHVGFLREAARYFRDERLGGAFGELVGFLVASEVDCSLLEGGRPLLGLLVDYRNLWAHGKVDDPEAIRRNAGQVRALTQRLLGGLSFLTSYRLEFEDGRPLMGSRPAGLGGEAAPLVVIAAGGRSLRPLLVKLKGPDLVLLEEADLSGMRLGFRGGSTYHRLTKKELKSGEGAELFESLKALLGKVRSAEAVLPLPDWDTFAERASVVTERTVSRYVDMRKYVPQWYVARPEWEGGESVFGRFMGSGKTLLALSGVQGTGKSALVCRLAEDARSRGHAALFVNAQRFTFAEVTWSGNPFPEYFAKLLHYERGFDGDGLRRLAKSAPEGKRIVLFIDAVNEVDGIGTKWNRFRAMELMLEWIAGIASSGVKVVLSFRLDAYEEFGYLERGEVPANLDEIAWPGTNPRKGWVTDLEPFDEGQARGLYEKLQAQPQYGMAPAMTWEEVRSGLGGKLAEFTSNPLLFLVFLRSHDAAASVITRDRDELFMSYAGKLTGSAEAAKRPWWRKVLGFLRNGNVTPKEQFLADIIDRMATEGGAAFLVERLEPKRSKRDRRLAQVIDDPRDPTFRDLKEGGLVAEEKIEARRGGAESLSRRVTFVGELMVTAMRGIERKVKRLVRVRSSAFMAVLFGAAIAAVVLAMRAIGGRFVLRLAAMGVPAEAFGRLVDHLTWLVLLLGLGAVCALAAQQLTADPEERMGDLGLMQKAYLFNADRTRLLLILKVAVAAGVPVLGVVVATITGADEASDSGLIDAMSPLVGLLLGAVFLVTPWGASRLILIASDVCPPRVTRSAHARAAQALRSGPARRARRTKAVVTLFSGIAFVPALAYTALAEPTAASEAEAVGLRGLSGAYVVRMLAVRFGEMGRDVWGGIIAVILVVVLGAMAADAYLYGWLLPHVHKGMAGRRSFAPRHRHFMVYAAVFWVLAGVTWGLTRTAASLTRVPEDIGPLVRLGVSSSDLRRNGQGKVVRLSLEKTPLGPEHAATLERYGSLEKLTLGSDARVRIDLRRFPAMAELTAPASAVGNVHAAADLERLVLIAPGSWFETIRAPAPRPLREVGLVGQCETLGNLSGVFTPFRLVMSEETARGIGRPWPELWPNTQLVVTSTGPPRLDWLTPQLARCVIRLQAPPDDATENLHLIEKLATRMDGADLSVLGKARSLRWLVLDGKQVKDAARLAQLLGLVRSSLPELQALDLVPGGWLCGPVPGTLSARGREETLDLLERLAAGGDRPAGER